MAAVLGIREIMVRIRRWIRILRSVPFTNRSGRPKNIPGTDPTDPDADSEHLYIYIIFQSHKKITKQYPEIKVFLSYYFCLMMEGPGSGLVTNGSECGSRRPKNIRILRIRIPNTERPRRTGHKRSGLTGRWAAEIET